MLTPSIYPLESVKTQDMNGAKRDGQIQLTGTPGMIVVSTNYKSGGSGVRISSGRAKKAFLSVQ